MFHRANRSERGAAAVEMAIVLPLLLLLIAGIIDFGRLMFTQAEVTNAAREGARMVSLNYTDAQALARAQAASPNVQGGPIALFGLPVRCPATPSPTDAASVTVTAPNFRWTIIGTIGNFFGGSISTPTPNSTASMRCLG